MARPKIQVIGIRQQNLHAQCFQIFLRLPFHSRLRADGHERGRINHAVGSGKAPKPRAGGISGKNFELKTHPRECIRNASSNFAGYRRPFPVLPAFFVRCHASHHKQRYARRSLGAFVVAIWCAAVASASASLAYFLFPLTGHFESFSTGRPSRPLATLSNPYSRLPCLHFAHEIQIPNFLFAFRRTARPGNHIPDPQYFNNPFIFLLLEELSRVTAPPDYASYIRGQMLPTGDHPGSRRRRKKLPLQLSDLEGKG